MELEEAKNRIKQLEDELNELKKKTSTQYREKIDTMSSEVVDSNPYR